MFILTALNMNQETVEKVKSKDKIMKMEYVNRGVCSRKTVIDLADDGTINDIRIVGGCNGNTSGLAVLLKGMKAQDAIERMKGIDCNGRGTSCPDQVARALEEAIKNLG